MNNPFGFINYPPKSSSMNNQLTPEAVKARDFLRDKNIYSETVVADQKAPENYFYLKNLLIEYASTQSHSEQIKKAFSNYCDYRNDEEQHEGNPLEFDEWIDKHFASTQSQVQTTIQPKTYTAIEVEQGIVWVDKDAKIKEGDYYFNSTGNAIERLTYKLPSSGQWCVKIIAAAFDLEGVPKLELPVKVQSTISDDELEQMAQDWYDKENKAGRNKSVRDWRIYLEGLKAMRERLTQDSKVQSATISDADWKYLEDKIFDTLYESNGTTSGAMDCIEIFKEWMRERLSTPPSPCCNYPLLKNENGLQCERCLTKYSAPPSQDEKSQEQIFAELIEMLGGFDNDRYKLEDKYFIVEKVKHKAV